MTLQEFSALVADTFGPDNTVITPAEVATVLLAIPSVIETEVSNALATAAATAGSEQKSVPGGVDTVAKTNIPLNSGPQIINGYNVPIGGTVLLTNQTNPAENGIYTLGNTGFTRTEGYTTPTDLSRLNVSVVYGNDAGNQYQQPNTLISGSVEKEFVLTNNFSENIKALIGNAKEEVVQKKFDITTSEPDEDGNVVVTPTYQIGNLLNGGKLRSVQVRQPDWSKTLIPGEEYTLANDGTLTITDTLPEAGKILLEVVTYGTLGASQGVVFETDGTTLFYRFGHETPADNKVAGPVTVVAGIQTFDTAAQAQAARSGNFAKITVVRNQAGSARLFTPPNIDQKLPSYDQ